MVRDVPRKVRRDRVNCIHEEWLHQLQRASRKVSRHLCVEAPCLPAGRVDASIRGKVGKHDDQSLFERHKPDQIHEEGLAGAILADDETNG